MPDSIATVDIPCPLCGSAMSRVVAKAMDHTYGVPGQFSVVRCADCGHLYLNPRPSDGSLLDCYPDDYAPYSNNTSEVVSRSSLNRDDHKGSHGEPSVEEKSHGGIQQGGIRGRVGNWLRWLWDEQAIVIPEPPQPGQSKMLELGCAHGGFLENAREQGWRVEGVEPNPLAVAAARERGLVVTEGFLDDFAGTPESLDWVALWMVLEHVPNPTEVTAKIARLLKPGGVVTLSIPNASTWERLLFGRHWLGYDVPRHLQDFTPTSIRHLLESHGFRHVRIQHQSNTRYWYGSIACWGRTTFPKANWPERWMEYFRNEPPRSWAWLLLLPGKINALLELSGRITVTATKR
ncbi:MAG: methyltransferase domain-containing protein [Aureliella sp.]